MAYTPGNPGTKLDKNFENDLLAIADTHLHRYDKAERPGRKLAHVNVVASSHAELLEKVRACQALIPDAPPVEWSFESTL